MHSEVEVAPQFAGPPGMGHGGYVAGMLTARTKGAVQVTLKRPTPLGVTLQLIEGDDGRSELRTGLGDAGEVIAESQPATLDLDILPPPTLAQALAAEAGSPSFYNDRGVHPTCFGCGNHRAEGDGLRIFAGPTTARGHGQVAAVWHPGKVFDSGDGTVDSQWVLAALDCPGAFAFIASETRAGLLGRIVFEQLGEVPAGEDLIVTGWQVGIDGRKLFAGTALFDEAGTPLAAAKATWFQMSGLPPRV